MNTILKYLKEQDNFTKTANGADAHKTTESAVLDMFALGGSYRQRSEIDCIFLFKKALEENEALALKCLFYLGDIRGGAGERRFFRVCFRWLCQEHPQIASRLMKQIPEFRRWDDILYCCVDTPVEEVGFEEFKNQLESDIHSSVPSLAGKWAPSENASNIETKRLGDKLRKHLHMTHKEYRKMLSELRSRIKIVEKLMTSNKWDEIEFDKLPSKAGLKYSHAFALRPETAVRYREFINNKTTKVNAGTLYPYEIVGKALNLCYQELDNTGRKAVNKYWENQIDYIGDANKNIICVCDTSGSMCCGGKVTRPIDVAIALSIYCGERLGGAFKNHYISFASRPRLIKIEGVDFVDKVARIYRTSLMDNTNLEAVFDLLKSACKTAEPKDRIDTIVVISDMQIDAMTTGDGFTTSNTLTTMEKIRLGWAAEGLVCPKLVYWNVNAINDTILDLGDNVSFVSGASPVIMKRVLSGKTGYELMLETLLTDRYSIIE